MNREVTSLAHKGLGITLQWESHRRDSRAGGFNSSVSFLRTPIGSVFLGVASSLCVLFPEANVQGCYQGTALERRWRDSGASLALKTGIKLGWKRSGVPAGAKEGSTRLWGSPRAKVPADPLDAACLGVPATRSFIGREPPEGGVASGPRWRRISACSAVLGHLRSLW